MQSALVLALFSAAGALAAGSYGPEALKDEIQALPGAPQVPWRMFSGYIDVSAKSEPKGTRMMFYWFVESQSKPSSDPVILWTNGGPGCSGLGGFLSEQGPFRVGEDKKTLELNDFAWNKVANMVFIEQPVGVGFSKAGAKIDYGDEQAAADNHRFVLGFFERYSEYRHQEFYISWESYGGHYMPTLAKRLKDGGEISSFRGVFLGNPLTYMMYRNFGQYGTAWGHQLLPAPLWQRYESAKCSTTFPPTDACNTITNEMDEILGDFDPYALDFPKCNTPQAVGHQERWALRRAIMRAKGAAGLAVNAPYQPCSQDLLTSYLNRADVQAVIHAKPGSKWSMCSDTVGSEYNTSDVNAPMMHVWQALVKDGDLKIMIYSGDDDSVCATLGSQQFVWGLGFDAKKGRSWSRWKLDGQVAGFRTDFEVPSKNGRGSFTFATVHGAGHMVPATQPERSLALLKDFLASETWEAKATRSSVVV